MYILGIDTSSNILTVTLTEDKKLISENHTDRQMGLLENLAPTVENILSESSLEPKELSAVAVSLGPGSFTGLRIGLAFGKALAYTLNIPIIGVPTMKAMACSAKSPFADLICPMIHARADEVYCAVFTGNMNEKVIDYTFMTVDELLSQDIFVNQKAVFMGTGAWKYKDMIEEKLKYYTVMDEMYNFPRGLCINSLAYDELARGKSDNIKTLAPMYIKKPTPVIRKEKGIIP